MVAEQAVRDLEEIKGNSEEGEVMETPDDVGQSQHSSKINRITSEEEEFENEYEENEEEAEDSEPGRISAL